MHATTEKLLEDHGNIKKLLDLLEIQAEHLESGEYADMQLISDIMHYFTNYPDVYHHPLEDRIFEALKNRDRNAADLIDEIYSEHQVIASNSTEILDEATRIQGGGISSRETFIQQLKDYITAYRSHIDKEESELFPLAEHTLGDEDWRSINIDMQDKEDPVFNKILEKEYEELYKVILIKTDET
ncbi:MAG: hemerythrin domain-containing protein [Gammaproteobacteria bacterium]